MYLKQGFVFITLLLVELIRIYKKDILKAASVATGIIIPILIISNLLLVV